MSPGPPPHQCLKIDRKCETVRQANPVLRSMSSANRKSDVHPNYQFVQPVRGAAVISNPCRQRSEPPLTGRVSEIRVRCYSKDRIK